MVKSFKPIMAEMIRIVRYIFVYLLIPTFAVGQGVRSRCPEGECSSGSISPYFYLFLFLIAAAWAAFKILKGNDEDRYSGIRFFTVSAKAFVIFIIIPVISGFLFSPLVAIWCFFILIVISAFSERVSEWIVGKDYNGRN